MSAIPEIVAMRGARSTDRRALFVTLAAGGPALLVGYVLARYGVGAATATIALPLLTLVLLARPFWILVGCTLVALAVPYTDAIGPVQATSFRVAAVGALAAVTVSAFSERRPARINAIDVVVAVFVALAVGSWVLQGVGTAADTINPLLPLAFYVAGRTLSGERVWTMLWAVAASGAVGSLSVLYEALVSRSALFVPRSEYLWNSSSEALFRPGGVYSSPPGAVTVLSITAICALPLIARYRGWIRVCAAACLVLSVAGVIATFTRAGYIGLVVGVLLYALLSGSRVLTVRRLILGTAVIGTIFAIAFLPRIAASDWFQEGIVRPGNLQVRESYWSLARPLITDSPVHLSVGHGINSLLVGHTELTAAVGPGLSTAPTLTTIGPHNQFVRTLLELGIAGFALAIAWLAVPPIRAAMHVRRRPEVRPVVGALVGSTAVFAIVSTANDSLRHPPSVAAVALATGVLVTLGSQPLQSSTGQAT